MLFTGDLIGAVFALGEIFRHGATGAAVGERKDGGAGRTRVGKAVGVNRHKQIGAVLVGDLNAIVQWNKGIAATRQTGIDAVAA